MCCFCGLTEAGQNLLWMLDTSTGTERVLADPSALLGAAGEALTREERARRERAREGAAGIVGYSTDESVSVAAFTLSGRLFVTDFSETRELPVRQPILDPQLAPDGRSVAYAKPDGSMRVCDLDGNDESLIEPRENETWGQAEFIAQEEMNRTSWVLVGSGLRRVARHSRRLDAGLSMVDRRPGQPRHPAHRGRVPVCRQPER